MFSVDSATQFLSVGLQQYVRGVLMQRGYASKRAATATYKAWATLPSALLEDTVALSTVMAALANSSASTITLADVDPESLVFGVAAKQRLDEIGSVELAVTMGPRVPLLAAKM